LVAKRHMHEYGTTREQLGAIAVNARSNAMLNPRALYREPLTLEDYLSARIITEPLCLYDCDAPIDGSTVVIVSSREAARDLRKPPLCIEAMSGAFHGRNSWDQFADLTGMAASDAGRHLWELTDLKPADVDVANLYDGFSILTLIWLEALGFCAKGDSGAFVEGGARIARDGVLPLNTGGGQLSAGRLHGFGLLWETCIQLWGEGGERQVSGNPQVGVTAAGGGPLGGCLLLTRQ
jgi:acetyl-CoA acetyltransferase